MIDRSEYDRIEIPEGLDDVIRSAVCEGRRTRRKSKIRSAAFKIGKAAAAAVICIAALTNLSPAFAQAAYQLPVIGQLCRIVTFREYQFEDEIKYIDVEILKIENTGKSKLEQRINLEIQNKINACVEENKKIAEEYYQAFLDTGGDMEEFIPIGITVDYDITCSNEKYVSFIISQHGTAFNTYYNEFYYNIDLESGQTITLKDCFGSNYKQVVAQSMEDTIAGWSEEQRAMLWEGLDFASLISENTSFYIDQQNRIVVVFPKYEIACGAAGPMEFVIRTQQ